MTQASPRILLASLATAVLLAACDASGVTPPSNGGVPPQFPARPGTWYMHTANDSALPHRIANRSVGVAVEETFLDSARIFVNSNGTYQQFYFLRINIQSVPDREEVILDEGFWTSFGGENRFRSLVRNRIFDVTFPAADRLQTSEQMLYWGGAPNVRGVYRLTRP
jgi:hypothetical protein